MQQEVHVVKLQYIFLFFLWKHAFMGKKNQEKGMNRRNCITAFILVCLTRYKYYLKIEFQKFNSELSIFVVYQT